MADRSPDSMLSIAAVVATKGRAAELPRLLDSLQRQTAPVDSILVVDQNADDRLVPVLAAYPDLPLRHMRTAEVKGLNRNRNLGWREADAEVVIFPDDDCWYPEDFMERARGLFAETGADAICGRPTDLSGRTINGRFLNTPTWVDRQSVWFTQIEWAFLVRREALEKIDGFDDELGVGAGSRWGAGEMQDLSLKLLEHGYQEYYNPTLTAHHPEIVLSPDGGDWYKRVPAYGRGMGYVLARHGYGWATALKWTMRPLVAALIAFLQLDGWRARVKMRTAWSRLEGYVNRRRHKEG